MIKNEIQALWNNKLLMFVLFAIMLIPTMYAGLFLASMWDPYGDLEYLPVAVVNNDKSVTYNDKELQVGKELADNLKDNDSMAFNVVDAKTAQEGLKNGTYYMVITIPENFSENASTLMDENPRKMVLDYQTNPGKNYISMKLSESAMKEIKSNLTEEITKTYAETVFDSIQTIGDGFEDAIDGTNDMIDGENQLADGNKKITDNLNLLASSSLTFQEGTDTLSKGLKSYTKGVATVDKGIDSLSKGTTQLSKDAVSGSKQLSDGATTLKKGVKDYTDGVSSVKTGTDQLVANNKAINEGTAALSKGAKELKAGGKKISEGLDSVNTSLGDLIVALGYTPQQLMQMAEGRQASMEQQTASPENEVVTKTTSSDNNEAVKTVTKAVNNTTGSIEDVSGYIESASDSLSVINSQLNNAKSILSELKDSNELTDEQKEQIQDAIRTISSTDEQISDASNVIDASKSKLSDAKESLSTVAETDLKRESVTVSTQKDNIEKIGAGPDNQRIGADLLTMYLTLNATMESAGKSGLIEGMQILNSGIDTLQVGIDGDGTASNPGLKPSIATYTGAASQINSGLKQITENNIALTSGSNSLATGANTLYKGLDSGVSQLNTGVSQLSTGTKKLVANNSTILNGAAKLSDGASKISDGASKLRDGSVELGDGLNQLQDGTAKLNEAMEDGKKEIRDNAASENTLDMFSAPIQTEETSITSVENNGHAMAGYMFSVGLWVGCLAFCLMYPLARYTGELKSGREWWASKAVILYPLSILMVVLLVGILHVTIGFNPASIPKTCVVGFAAVAAFMSIMYFFNLLLGKVGSFLMLLFMVLQLAGSAGTYPVEISGNLANSLHKWVPFTYSVDGFRAAIAENGPSVVHECVVLFGISIVFTLLTLLVFRIRAKRTLEHKPFIYEWIEEHGLA